MHVLASCFRPSWRSWRFTARSLDAQLPFPRHNRNVYEPGQSRRHVYTNQSKAMEIWKRACRSRNLPPPCPLQCDNNRIQLAQWHFRCYCLTLTLHGVIEHSRTMACPFNVAGASQRCEGSGPSKFQLRPRPSLPTNPFLREVNCWETETYITVEIPTSSRIFLPLLNDLPTAPNESHDAAASTIRPRALSEEDLSDFGLTTANSRYAQDGDVMPSGSIFEVPHNFGPSHYSAFATPKIVSRGGDACTGLGSTQSPPPLRPIVSPLSVQYHDESTYYQSDKILLPLYP
jgi:hypothetical protein